MTNSSLETPTELHFRIWSEFHSMPGLRVTQEQICRLVAAGRAEVAEALRGLVDAGALDQIGPYFIRADICRYTA